MYRCVTERELGREGNKLGQRGSGRSRKREGGGRERVRQTNRNTYREKRDKKEIEKWQTGVHWPVRHPHKYRQHSSPVNPLETNKHTHTQARRPCGPAGPVRETTKGLETRPWQAPFPGFYDWPINGPSSLSGLCDWLSARARAD